MKPMCDGRMKLYSNGPGQMTKMADMLKVKSLKKSSQEPLHRLPWN